MSDISKKSIIEFLDIRKGRLHRCDFLIFLICIGILSDFVNFLDAHSDGLISFLLILPLSSIFYLNALIVVKRLRDINLSGWFYLPIALIYNIDLPASNSFYIVITILYLIFLCLLCIPPQDKNNRYGNLVQEFFYHTPPLDFYNGKKDTPAATFKTSVKSVFLFAIGVVSVFAVVTPCMFYALYLFDSNFKYLPDDPFELLFLSAFLLLFLLILVGIPTLVFIKRYPVKLYEQGIEGYNINGSTKGWCRWEDIKYVEIKKSFFFTKYIQLQDEKGEELFSILHKGLDNYDEFKKQVTKLAGKENPLSQFLT